MDRRQGCVEYCISHGGRESRINWADIDHKSLHFDEAYSSNYEAPVDEHWDFNLYVSEKGKRDEKSGHCSWPSDLEGPRRTRAEGLIEPAG